MRDFKSGPDKTVENQVGASGWFVRLNLFAMSQNRWIGGSAVIEYIGRVCYAGLNGVYKATFTGVLLVCILKVTYQVPSVSY